MVLEPSVYVTTERLSKDYTGGYWDFFELCNGGFYMAPDDDRTFHVVCENYFEGDLSADALGITVCLYAYSHLSYTGGSFARCCAEQYYRLRPYAMEHPEAGAISAATD